MINKYFQSQQGVAAEQDTVDKMTIELIQQSGHDFQYIPRDLNQTTDDQILHEAPLSTFTEYFTIEGLVENFEGFGPDQEMLAKFGLMLNQEIEVTFSRSRFIEITDIESGPVEGSLLYYSPTNSLFEITHLEDEPNFITLGSKTQFKFKAKLFQYSYETIDTDIEEVDGVIYNEDINFGDNDAIETKADDVTIFNSSDPLGGW